MIGILWRCRMQESILQLPQPESLMLQGGYFSEDSARHFLGLGAHPNGELVLKINIGDDDLHAFYHDDAVSLALRTPQATIVFNMDTQVCKPLFFSFIINGRKGWKGCLSTIPEREQLFLFF